ncbi:MAG TPA: TetR/AcrR family transcriptional regulator [Spirochaetota bacterium]|jgi:AcrR family transcriptional regulator|nr:TetR/AcrR family transcriptional regulator [Spirochaetota bacterium]HPV39944.1 TetR/AcrR family transcriptional regulator [Spirochaetota bacterium]
MKKKYHKETFDNIPEEKRLRLIETTIRVMGRKGISSAKIEDIAREMGVSYGSIYSYFATKDDLAHTIITMGIEIQRKTFEQPVEHRDTFSHIEAVLERSLKLGREQPELICLWHEMSLPSNAQYAEHTTELFRLGVIEWKSILRKGTERGEIRADIDIDAAAFMLNAMTSQLLRYNMSDFQKKKHDIHFSRSPEDPIPGLMAELKKMLA